MRPVYCLALFFLLMATSVAGETLHHVSIECLRMSPALAARAQAATSERETIDILQRAVRTNAAQPLFAAAVVTGTGETATMIGRSGQTVILTGYKATKAGALPVTTPFSSETRVTLQCLPIKDKQRVSLSLSLSASICTNETAQAETPAGPVQTPQAVTRSYHLRHDLRLETTELLSGPAMDGGQLVFLAHVRRLGAPAKDATPSTANLYCLAVPAEEVSRLKRAQPERFPLLEQHTFTELLGRAILLDLRACSFVRRKKHKANSWEESHSRLYINGYEGVENTVAPVTTDFTVKNTGQLSLPSAGKPELECVLMAHIGKLLPSVRVLKTTAGPVELPRAAGLHLQIPILPQANTALVLSEETPELFGLTFPAKDISAAGRPAEVSAAKDAPGITAAMRILWVLAPGRMQSPQDAPVPPVK